MLFIINIYISFGVYNIYIIHIRVTLISESDGKQNMRFKNNVVKFESKNILDWPRLKKLIQNMKFQTNESHIF